MAVPLLTIASGLYENGLRQRGVERFHRRSEVERTGGRIAIGGEPVPNLAVHAVHGPHPLTQRGLALTEGHEVQADRAIVEGVRGRTA